MAEKMPLISEDIRAERIARLREDFPEMFTEGRIDFERLKQALGVEVDEGRERYGLSWAGKSEAVRNIQTPSVATLVPDREESVEFDDTENVFIEGDNLEVLKLLQKGYHGCVKMIYIDPPYSTGNEFIYPDNFREGIDDYLRYSGQVSGNGRKLSTNTETGGRYHSRWLSMMYPRLFLARNLLRENGVIFVSIDDHEVHNLRAIMDEIFGEENFIGVFTWQSKKGGGSDNASVVADQQYVACFTKTGDTDAIARLTVEAEPVDKYDEKGPYRRGRELNKWGANSRREDRPTMFFPIPGPHGEAVYPIRNDGVQGCWRWGRKNMLEIVERGNVEFVERPNGPAGTYTVYEKIRSTGPRIKPYRTWLTDVGTTAGGSKTVKEIFDGRKVYDFPKPVKLIKHLLSVGTSGKREVVLDFFAGSCTLAQAIMELNDEDDGDRTFVCVQVPERTSDDSEARQLGYDNIADIGKERIRRVIRKLNEEDKGMLRAEDELPQDRGFKVFKLTSSNVKIWDGSTASEELEDLAEQLRAFADNVLPDRSREDILYEILLKSGLPHRRGTATGVGEPGGLRRVGWPADGLPRGPCGRGVDAGHRGSRTGAVRLPGHGFRRQRQAQDEHGVADEGSWPRVPDGVARNTCSRIRFNTTEKP
jgi:adenine-specific DNA-methyltransferase